MVFHNRPQRFKGLSVHSVSGRRGRYLKTILKKILAGMLPIALLAACGGGGGGSAAPAKPPEPSAAACTAQTFSWTVDGQTCTAPAGPANSGQSVTVSDVTGSTTGSAIYSCSNGVWSGPSGTLCAPPAPPPAPGSAVTYYFSDCQAGAQAGCVPGDDANLGTSPQAPRRTMSGINVDALPAGTQLLFARGGAWNDFGLVISNPNVTSEQPLVFASYAAAWSGNARPWLRVSSLTSVFVFGWYNETQNDGGYTVRGLKLDGQPFPDGAGIFIGNNVHHVLLEDLEVTGFHIGIQSVQNGDYPTQYTLRNSHIHHNPGMGLLGDGRGIVIENNLFEANNFSGSGFNHAIYLGGHGQNGTIRNNRFLRNSVVNGRCTGGNVTVHGQWDDLVIENNTIEQDASDLGCYGFSINGGYDTPEYFHNVVIRNNRIINLGGCGICLTSAPGAVVENNLIVSTQNTYHAAILIPDRAPGTGDAADTGAVIRNNTIYYSQSGSGSEAIAFRANNGGAGANLQVVSNLIYFGSGSNASHSCFTHPGLASFTAFDNNLCHHASGAGSWSTTYATPAAAQSAGFDVHSQSANPLFVEAPAASNNWNDQIQTGSPARNNGHPTRSSAEDRIGVARDATPNIGARE